MFVVSFDSRRIGALTTSGRQFGRTNGREMYEMLNYAMQRMPRANNPEQLFGKIFEALAGQRSGFLSGSPGVWPSGMPSPSAHVGRDSRMSEGMEETIIRALTGGMGDIASALAVLGGVQEGDSVHANKPEDAPEFAWS